MLYKEKIYEGMSVEIVVHEGDYKGKYRSRVEEVGKRILSLGVPITNNQFIPLREGTILEVFFSDDLAAYAFSTTIIKRISHPIPTFIMEFPNKIKRVQRRKYVRVPLVHPIKYRILEKEGLSEEKNSFMNDLSGGGLLFKSKMTLPPQTIIILRMTIGDSELEVPGIVIRSLKDDDKNCYMVSVEFQEISERTRDIIISYVFDLQREILKKGLV